MKINLNAACVEIDNGGKISCYSLCNILWMELEGNCVKLYISERVQPRILRFESEEEAHEGFVRILEGMNRVFSL